MPAIGSISGSTTPPSALDVPPGATGTTPTGGVAQIAAVTPPIAFALPFPRLTLGSLGLGNPQNSDDYAAVIADLQSKLDKATKGTRDARVLEHATGVRSALNLVTGYSNEIVSDIGAVKAATAQQAVDTQNETQSLNAYNADVAKIGPADVPGSAIANAQSQLNQDAATLATTPQTILVGGQIVPNPAYAAAQAQVAKDQAVLNALQFQYQETQDYKAEIDAQYKGDTEGAAQAAARVEADRQGASAQLQSVGLTATGFEGVVADAESNYNNFNAARVDFDKQTRIITADTAQMANDQAQIAFLLSGLMSTPQIVNITASAVDRATDLNRNRATDFTYGLTRDFSARLAQIADRAALASLLQRNAADQLQPTGVGQAPPESSPTGPVNEPAKAALAALLAGLSDILSALTEAAAAGESAPGATLQSNSRMVIPA